MNFLGFLWIASYIGSFFSPHSFFRAPDELFKAFPAKALAVVSSSIQYSSIKQTYLSTPVAARSRSWWNVVGYASARPGGISQPIAMNVSASHSHDQSTGQSARHLRAIASRVSMQDSTHRDASHKILQRLQNLPNLPQVVRQNLWSSPPSVTVVRTGRYSSDHGASNLASQQSASQCDASQPGLTASSPAASQTIFQVRVKGHMVAEVPSHSHAKQIADQLKQALQDRDLSAAAVRPALIKSQPGAKADGEVLFVVSEQLAEDINQDSELLAIAWVNNLRTALGAQTLSVTEARTHMLGFVETDQTFSGLASWYGPYFHGRATATGEVFNENALTAAHRSLPFNTYLRVTNLHNDKVVTVRINDRGPYIEGRSLDLSRQAARCLQSETSGVVPFEAVVLQVKP